ASARCRSVDRRAALRAHGSLGGAGWDRLHLRQTILVYCDVECIGACPKWSCSLVEIRRQCDCDIWNLLWRDAWSQGMSFCRAVSVGSDEPKGNQKPVSGEARTADETLR